MFLTRAYLICNVLFRRFPTTFHLGLDHSGSPPFMGYRQSKRTVSEIIAGKDNVSLNLSKVNITASTCTHTLGDESI